MSSFIPGTAARTAKKRSGGAGLARGEEVTLLNVSKCGVPRICDELRSFGKFDEEVDGAAFKRFKDIETSLWLADHKKREAHKAEGLSEEESRARDKAAAEAARAAIIAIQEKEAAEAKRGVTKTSEFAGTVPRADWAWSMSAAVPKEDETQVNAMSSSFGLSFQEIQGYNLYKLRQKMDEYSIFESMPKAKEAYKSCEELMAKLVKVLLDPKATRLPQEQDAKQNPTSKSIVARSNGGEGDTSETTPEVLDGSNGTDSDLGKSVTKAEAKTPNVRRGDEITLENVPSLTLYELRQELERRGEFGDFLSKKKTINFKTMLRAMQNILLKEKEERDAIRAEREWEKPEEIKARLAKAKADRKAEALERSRLRQIERKKEDEAAAEKGLGEENDACKDENDDVADTNAPVEE